MVGFVFEKQGRLTEAEAGYQGRALSGRIAALHLGHGPILRTSRNLEFLYEPWGMLCANL